jgi:hypothetical protein
MGEGVTNSGEHEEDKGLGRKKPNRFQSVLLTLATIGTILGGILAAFEIYGKVAKDDSDSQQLSLQGDASLEVPKDWEIMDADAIQVMTRGVDPQFDALMSSSNAKCLQFIGPAQSSGAASGAVCVVIGKTIPNLDYDSIAADMRGYPGNTLCKKVELENGPGVHCVFLRESVDPDGYPIPITQDCYVFIRGDDMWMLMFMCEDQVYMRNSGTFAKIAASFDVD